MKEVYEQAQKFLNEVFGKSNLELKATAAHSEQGCLLTLSGEDAALLRGEGGELLDAIEYLVNQSFLRELPHGERLICDVDNFRAAREAELRMMARHAANKVRSSGVPFTFSPMSAGERRVIHLELANENGIHTESVGEGNARRLKVSLKSPAGK